MTSLGLGFTAPSCARSAPAWVSARCQGWSQLCALELWGGGVAATVTRVLEPCCLYQSCQTVVLCLCPKSALECFITLQTQRAQTLLASRSPTSVQPLAPTRAPGTGEQRPMNTPRCCCDGGAEPAAAPQGARADHGTPQPLLASGCLVASPMAGLCPGCRSEGSPGPALSHHVWPPAQRDRAWHRALSIPWTIPEPRGRAPGGHSRTRLSPYPALHPHVPSVCSPPASVCLSFTGTKRARPGL